MNFTYTFIFLLIFTTLLTSCSSIKNIKYFSDISDSTKTTQLAKLNFVEPKIQSDDILSITVQTIDPLSTQIFSVGNIQSSAIGNTSTGGAGGTISGYLVDSKGNIELPVIGNISVVDLTTEQAKERIRERVSKFYKNPSVNLRFANFKITILGEVLKPGTYVVSNEKVSILDALGLAGDLTVYGKRNNIVLIREQNNGGRILVKLDLTSSKILSSPYYYLRQNDYIYVEASKSKIAQSDAIQNRNISIITAIGASLISVLAILLSTNKI